MLEKRWHPGQSCVHRGIVNNRVWLAQSVIVVKDEPGETILALMPGAQCAFPVGYWQRWRGDSLSGSRWQEARRPVFTLREFSWHTKRVLMFLEPQKYYACWMFWDNATDHFLGYYVNFQLPYQRSQCGFDTLDLDLDIVIEPDFNWHWKDEAEYQQGIEEGGIDEDWVKGIEQAQPKVFERLNKRAHPFDGSWISWRPDPAWTPPSLLDGWRNP